MNFSINIKHISSIVGHSDIQGGVRSCFKVDKSDLMPLDWLKPIQRRRLSPFAKLAISCAYNALQQADELSQTDIIFGTRHADLHKTNMMLKDLAVNHELSPTAFSLSVHNAVPGLLSIFTENKNQHTTITSGRDTLMMCLVEAYIRLKSTAATEILVVVADEVLPDEHLADADEQQYDYCVAFVVSLDGDNLISVATNDANETNETPELPIAICLLNWLRAEQKGIELILANKRWKVDKEYVSEVK